MRSGRAASELANKGVEAAVILWMTTAELAHMKTLPRLPDACC